jgi:predicted glycosyltransferase
MRVLVDIIHPAHVHFFRNPLKLLRARGHDVLVTSRMKECAVELLDQLGIEHRSISAQEGKGVLALGRELLVRERALRRIAKSFRPDVMAGIGGVFIAHVGAASGIPSLAFYDTENATLQNAITYPFASCVIVPECYGGWVPRSRHIRYAGYHELSYLHPAYFEPDRVRALANGLAANGETFLVRVVSWRASHDIGERGWSPELLDAVVAQLSQRGRVLVSAEGALPERHAALRYPGAASELHHVMAFCRALVGESATMASEAAVLGVPAVYAAATGRGYTDEQERRYGLVRNVKELAWTAIGPALEALLRHPASHWQLQRRRLLQEKCDVAAFVADCIEQFPGPLQRYRRALAG